MRALFGLRYKDYDEDTEYKFIASVRKLLEASLLVPREGGGGVVVRGVCNTRKQTLEATETTLGWSLLITNKATKHKWWCSSQQNTMTYVLRGRGWATCQLFTPLFYPFKRAVCNRHRVHFNHNLNNQIIFLLCTPENKQQMFYLLVGKKIFDVTPPPPLPKYLYT